jgi:hypothetical protein
MKSQSKIVVAGQIDIGPATHRDRTSVSCIDLNQISRQLVSMELTQEGFISAFASTHVPVLALAPISSNEWLGVP